MSGTLGDVRARRWEDRHGHDAGIPPIDGPPKAPRSCVANIRNSSVPHASMSAETRCIPPRNLARRGNLDRRGVHFLTAYGAGV